MRRWYGVRVGSGLLALSVALPCQALQSQTSSPRADPVVVGTLSDALSGAAVEGAMVVLLDADGEIVARSMTNPAGAFGLSSSNGGRFVVRADRIGHESTLSEALTLNAGDTVRITLAADVRAVQLEALDVEADPRCFFRPDEGRAVSRLWAEARKSLETARWSRRHGVYEYEFVEFERIWDPSHARLRDQQLRRRVETGQAMFGSVPVDALVTEGFVVPDGQARIYRGPDAEVMLSDPFLDGHCFRIGRRAEGEERISLEFEPVDDVDLAEIEGRLWLDRQTGELLSIEYRYTNAHRRWGEDRFGGRIEFDRLPSGPSIVRRWAIWMPSVERRFGESRERLMGILEQGAEVLRVRQPRGNTLREYDAGGVRGVVTRGPNQQPAEGVIVALDGLDSWAESDASGGFEIAPLIAGPYTIRVHDETLTRVGRELPTVPIRVAQGSKTTRNLHLEDPAQVLFEYCGNRRDFAVSAVLVGRVRDANEGALIEGAQVRISWVDAAGRRQNRDSDTNRNGFYVACSLPRGVRLAVHAERDRSSAQPILLTVPEGAHEVTLDLALNAPPGH